MSSPLVTDYGCEQVESDGRDKPPQKGDRKLGTSTSTESATYHQVT